MSAGDEERDMSCHKCAGALPAAGMSRRGVLNRFGMGLGGIASRQPRQPGHTLRRPAPGQDAACSAVGFIIRRKRNA